MNQAIDTYRVFAIKYAHHERSSSANFLGGDSHDVPMPLDYFVWAIVGENRVFVVDTGFDPEMAAKRGRQITNTVERGLRAVGVDPDAVEDVILTHMHYDHAGNHDLFARARYHLQDREMAYCTGRCMCHGPLSHAFEAADVCAMVQRVFKGKARFHDGDSNLAPGLSVHLVGGHTNGLQVVRVHTARGWLVLASDAAHFYANIEQSRPFPIVYNVGDMLAAYGRIYSLADAPALVVPGHDPEVLRRFPAAAPALKDWVVRLDSELPR
jgi:glyoxylase-like metal-dependent hydrolase (beta-lactamase superfamily II)